MKYCWQMLMMQVLFMNTNMNNCSFADIIICYFIFCLNCEYQTILPFFTWFTSA